MTMLFVVFSDAVVLYASMHNASSVIVIMGYGIRTLLFVYVVRAQMQGLHRQMQRAHEQSVAFLTKYIGELEAQLEG